MATKTEEILHILTYSGENLCEARPGKRGEFVPVNGTNCIECKKRDKAFDASTKP